ncbi:hypothetical protein BDN72DRAFT_956199 [Pluteus cervinus]|uniref:Uncharacterized protein n=1 Tax=Pluteus cervinus TaxID=181527 RepID=A0ACD3B831_9AGAR|nr:hypothetical protein BDN72DRAFT_956199 [Pluteus cervinus]
MDEDREGPRLPPELEKEIFTLSFSESLHQKINPGNLFLVSKRVFDWLMPLYWDVVMAHTAADGWPPTFSEQTLQLYGHHVHHFHTWESSFVKLLTLCPNISDLAIWTSISEQDVDYIIKLPITRLSIFIDDIRWGNADLHEFCSKVTHLDISNRMDWATNKIIPHFPALTHLATFSAWVAGENIQSWFMHGSPLEAVILISSGSGDGLHLREAEDDDLDPRVVRVGFGRTYKVDWVEGAHGRMDMWEFADEVIKNRRLSSVHEAA